MADKERDPEFEALERVAEAFDKLKPEQVRRVLKYALDRAGVKQGDLGTEAPEALKSTTQGKREQPEHKEVKREESPPMDIRSFAQTKTNSQRPEKEHVLTVMFYLTEIAPEKDRLGSVSKPDVERYLKQANLPIPKHLGQVLVNIKNGGYIDSQESGQYKLNPVGYNFVAHRLPAGVSVPGVKVKPKRKKSAKKALKGKASVSAKQKKK